jgi:hypothetical protein
MNTEPPASNDTAVSPKLPRLGSFQAVVGTVRTRIHALALVVRLTRLSRHCALSTRVLASMPRPLDVVVRPMSDIATGAAKFADVAAREREDFESHYRDNRKRVIACAWELAYMAEDSNERIAYEFACASLRANRTKTGYRVLKTLAFSENETSKYVLASKRRLARLSWKAGDLDTAVKAFRSVRGRAARSQYRTWLGVATVRNGLLIAESGNEESGRAVLIGGLLATGMDRDIAERVAAIYLYAACKTPIQPQCTTNSSTEPATSSESQGPVPIILSGFGWSGSGAVADFLKGSCWIEDVFSGREMGLWTGKYGLDRLYAHFVTRGFNRRLLLEFLTRHCFGHIFLGNSKGTKSLGGLWTRLPYPKRWLLLQGLAQWLESIYEWRAAPEYPLLDAFQTLSSMLLRLLSGERTPCVLLSNCIPSDTIIGIRMFRSPAVIVSWRDPADAYASKKAAFPDNTLDFDGWKNQLLTRINKYLAGKKEVAAYAKLWMDISFEEFVQDDRLRRRLLMLLNLEDQPMQATFDPVVSARNIGIHESIVGKNMTAWNELASTVSGARIEAMAISRNAIGEPEPLSSGDLSWIQPKSSL